MQTLAGTIRAVIPQRRSDLRCVASQGGRFGSTAEGDRGAASEGTRWILCTVGGCGQML